MTLKMHQILQFHSFYDKVKDQKIPIKTAYKFSKLISKLDTEVKFYQQKFQTILEKYAEKEASGKFKLTEDKQGFLIREDSREICKKEIEELHTLDVEISGVEFSLEELENLNITVEEINVIMPFIKE